MVSVAGDVFEIAHPCQSKETRRVMRELHLYWISLPYRTSVGFAESES